MVTTEEIRRRVKEADTARSAKRAAAAEQIGELAQRRAALAEQLADVERELGDVLAGASDVIDINELARFTDVSPADLTRWRDGRRTTRSKRKKPADGAPAMKSDRNREPSAAKTPAADQTSRSSEPVVPLVDLDAPARVTAAMT